jgi:hypothetical protein
MGGMSHKPHSEDPSVFDEMQKTFHKSALQDFKPSLPPSIQHPHSSGFGALPADVRAGLAPPAPQGYAAAAAAPPPPPSPAAAAESNPFTPPDPLQAGESGIASADGESVSEEEQEREAKKEEEREEAEKERKEEAAKKAEQEKEEKEEEEEEVIDARDGGRLSLPPPPSAGALDDEPSSPSPSSIDSVGTARQLVPDAPDPCNQAKVAVMICCIECPRAGAADGCDCSGWMFRCM